MDQVQTVQRFAFDGWLTPAQGITLGVVLAAVAALLFWREFRMATSPRLVPLLFVFRLGALGLVLWMLAGPAVFTTTTRQGDLSSIAVFVDASASMGLLDPVDGSGASVRWALASGPGSTRSPMTSLDAAQGAMGAAVVQLRLGERDGREFAYPPVEQALEAARRHLTQALSDLPPGESAAAGHLLRELETSLAPALASVREVRRTASDQELARLLQVLHHELDRLIRQLDQLALRTGSSYEDTFEDSRKFGLAEESKRPRIAKAAAWLDAGETTWVPELSEKANWLRYSFGVNAAPVADDSWMSALRGKGVSLAGATDLNSVWRQVNQEAGRRPVSAVVLVTDGGHNAGPDPRMSVAAMDGVPLFIVPIGNTTMQRDVILHSLHAPRMAFSNDVVVVEMMVTAYGCEGEEMQVELLHHDQVIDSQTLQARSDLFDARVSLVWKAEEIGRQELEVRVRELPEERTAENNYAELSVDVVEDTVTVLLADRFPRWEFRYLLNLFNRDETIEHDVLLFEPHHTFGGESGPRPAFPRDVNALRRYRVIILGDLAPAQLTYAHQEALRDYVLDRGGTLVVIAGREAMPELFMNQPLGALIPAEAAASVSNGSSGYLLEVTGEGALAPPIQLDNDPARSRQVWTEVSRKLPIYNLSPVSRPRLTAHSLIEAVPEGGREEAGPRTFLAWHYAGNGKVVYLAAPASYQLRFRYGDRYHHRFWGNLLRWALARDMATGSRTVRLTTDKAHYEAGEAAHATVRLSQLDGRPIAAPDSELLAWHEGEVVQRIPLQPEPGMVGTYRGVLENLPPGRIAITAGGPGIETLLRLEGRAEPVEVAVTVDPIQSAELRHPVCNLPLLGQISQAADGIVLPPGAVPEALAHLNLDPAVEEETVREPLWNRWVFFWAFMVCISLEWAGRKFAGLL